VVIHNDDASDRTRHVFVSLHSRSKVTKRPSKWEKSRPC
jgi:hypothetical protein